MVYGEGQGGQILWLRVLQQAKSEGEAGKWMIHELRFKRKTPQNMEGVSICPLLPPKKKLQGVFSSGTGEGGRRSSRDFKIPVRGYKHRVGLAEGLTGCSYSSSHCHT